MHVVDMAQARHAHRVIGPARVLIDRMRQALDTSWRASPRAGPVPPPRPKPLHIPRPPLYVVLPRVPEVSGGVVRKGDPPPGPSGWSPHRLTGPGRGVVKKGAMSLPKCEHGVARNDGRWVGLWAAPFDECRCCGTSYPYIDSASFGPDGSSGRTWTKGRCPQCGGRYEEWAFKRDAMLPTMDAAARG